MVCYVYETTSPGSEHRGSHTCLHSTVGASRIPVSASIVESLALKGKLMGIFLSLRKAVHVCVCCRLCACVCMYVACTHKHLCMIGACVHLFYFLVCVGLCIAACLAQFVCVCISKWLACVCVCVCLPRIFEMDWKLGNYTVTSRVEIWKLYNDLRVHSVEMGLSFHSTEEETQLCHHLHSAFNTRKK